MNIYNKLKFVGLMFLVLGVSACGGGGGDTPIPPPLEKTYTVALSVPDELSPPGGYDLSAANFAVAIVDPTGNILEVVDIPADDITENTDGTWQITIPGDLRLDQIIMVDIAKSVEVFVDNPIPSGVLYAPTTALSIDIDIQSTAGYQEFLQYQATTITTFAELTNISIDEVENIINTAQEVVLSPITSGQTLDDYIVTAVTEVATVIAEEIAIAEVPDTTTPTPGSLDVAVAAGGIYWFEGPTQSFIPTIEYGVITNGSVEQVFNFDGTDFTLVPSVTSYSLTATGFQLVSELTTVSSINANGSVTVAWEGDANMSFTINPVETVDVNAMNIQSYFTADEDTEYWATVLDPSITFSTSGALAFRSNLTVVNSYYEIYGEINCDPMTADPATMCYGSFLLDGTGLPIQTLSEMVSTTKGQKLYLIGMTALSTKGLVANLVDNGTSKTVYFYEVDTDPAVPPVELTETTTWDYVTENSVEFLRFTPPAALTQDWEIFTGTSTLAFFEYASYVRQAEFIPAGTTTEGSFWLFNESAAQDILLAVDTSGPVVDPAPGGTCDMNPISFSSYADFEAATDACGGAIAITTGDLEGITVSYASGTATMTFNLDGTVAFTQGGTSINRVADWSINASGNILLEDLVAVGGAVYALTEFRIIEINPGLEYSVKAYTDDKDFGGNGDLLTGSDGTIWSLVWSLM